MNSSRDNRTGGGRPGRRGSGGGRRREQGRGAGGGDDRRNDGRGRSADARPSGGGDRGGDRSGGPRGGSGPPRRGPGGGRGPGSGPPQRRGRNDEGRPASPASRRPSQLTAHDLASALIAQVQSRLQRLAPDPGHGIRRESVSLTLDVPVASGPQRITDTARQLEAVVDAAVRSYVGARALALGAATFCQRCASSHCEHGKPTPRQVFVGYAATGQPRFIEYSQALLDLGDERMSHLYGPSGDLVTRLWTGEELERDLLAPLAPSRGDGHTHRLLGQVTAGWYWVPDGVDTGDAPRNFAMTFQVFALEGKGQAPRLSLSAVGASPLGGALEDLHDVFGELPWGEAERWCRSALGDVERSLRRGAVRDENEDVSAWEERVQRIIAGFERRLTRRERAAQRRTRHAEDRRRQQRPTGHAVSDLASASDEAVLHDARRDTFVVLGDRGRTHIFNPGGRLVTSIQYTAEAIEKRRRTGRWLPADEEGIRKLREAVAG